MKMTNTQYFHLYIVKCEQFFNDRMTERNYYAVVEFEDGVQLIPSNWLIVSGDFTKAMWPNFTNNNRFDKNQ